jgi:hypothetical protein
MIPAFNDFGLLPPGIHSCSLEQFQHVFAFNVRRQQLFESLTQCLQSMHRESLTGAVLLDGSYATDKQDPSDVEVVLDVRQQERADQDKALVFLVRQHNDLKSTGVDWYLNLEDGGTRDFTMYFQYIGEKTAAVKRCRPKDLKGILRLTEW